MYSDMPLCCRQEGYVKCYLWPRGLLDSFSNIPEKNISIPGIRPLLKLINRTLEKDEVR